MHSSRMRTGHSLSVFGGGGDLVPGGVPGPGGCTWSRGVYLVPGGVPGPRGVYLVLGGCTWSGGCTWGVSARYTPQTRPGTPPPGPDQVPPLLTESQTGVKILPWPNFVAAGNYVRPNVYIMKLTTSIVQWQ